MIWGLWDEKLTLLTERVSLGGFGETKEKPGILLVSAPSWEDGQPCEVQVGKPFRPVQARLAWTIPISFSFRHPTFLPSFSRCSSNVTHLAQAFSSPSQGRSHHSLLPWMHPEKMINSPRQPSQSSSWGPMCGKFLEHCLEFRRCSGSVTRAKGKTGLENRTRGGDHGDPEFFSLCLRIRLPESIPASSSLCSVCVCVCDIS